MKFGVCVAVLTQLPKSPESVNCLLELPVPSRSSFFIAGFRLFDESGVPVQIK